MSRQQSRLIVCSTDFCFSIFKQHYKMAFGPLNWLIDDELLDRVVHFGRAPLKIALQR